MKKYRVIGGQYERIIYGESDTLHGAKIIARKNPEYWDNWQGWHIPAIYDDSEVPVATANYGERGWWHRKDDKQYGF